MKYMQKYSREQIEHQFILLIIIWLSQKLSACLSKARVKLKSWKAECLHVFAHSLVID